MKFDTKVIHAGVRPDPFTGAVMTPIYQTSTYVQESLGVNKGYEYGRTKNPTRSVLEENLAALESGAAAICFSSGLAAFDAILKMFSPGDEIIATNDLYGGSYRLMNQVYAKYGLKFSFIDLSDTDQLSAAITNKTKMIWVETPTNPMLQIIDIESVATTAQIHGIITCVDNTFASPYLQQPLALGADIVLHSATKYLGGHSDVVHGAVVCKHTEHADKIRFFQNAAGAVPGPMDCFLVLRGIKTLHVRMQRACENATAIARYLYDHPTISQVYYPGLESHPKHDIAKKQMKHFGAMLSFDMHQDQQSAANTVLSKTKLFHLAESLGGVESLIGHPATMTHASIPKQERLNVGITDSLIRLSVGIEHVDDLIEDLATALDHI